MKIAFFTDTYLPNTDGVVRSIVNIQKILESRGHEIVVFAPFSGEKVENYRNVYYLKSVSFSPYPQYKLALLNPYLFNKKLAKMDVELVHNHGVALTAIAARNSSVPKISSFHTNIAEAVHYVAKGHKTEKLFKKCAWKYVRWLYSKFDMVTAPSFKAIKELETKGIKANLLPNGVDTSSFEGKRHPERSPLLIHVGRVVKEKNIELIIKMVYRARKSYPEIKLKIIGKGPALDHYKRMVSDLGAKDFIEFTGYVDDRTLKNYYKRADALVFASRFDTQGIVILESLASGTPVIALKGTSGEEIVKGMGTVFTNEISFISAVKRAMEIDDARKFVDLRPYDMENIVSNLEKYYKKILNY